VALGRAGLRQAPRQFHLQLSQRIIFIPSHFFTPRMNPSFQPEPDADFILNLYAPDFILTNMVLSGNNYVKIY
jgi:hypothetical protein